MLQQTTVATVAPRWERFLRSFPTLDSLAAASEEEVLAEWSGLGYYSRARNLLAAARAIGRAERFPRTAAELERLPGFGRYTAAAVASIAFGESVATVDTNVERVLGRFLGVPDRRGAPGRRRIREAADGLVPAAGPGDHNQAMMELGATVCRPVAPGCGTCPLAGGCAARKAGDPSRFDPPARRSPPRRVVLAAGLATRRGRIVLVPDREMVRGHWTLPFAKVPDGRDPAGTLEREWPRLAGRAARSLRPAGRVVHAVLDRRYSVHLFAVEEGGRAPASPRLSLVSEAEVTAVARGSFLDKALAAARKASEPGNGRGSAAVRKRSPSPRAGKGASDPGARRPAAG